MSIRRIVMRNHCRKIADDYRKKTILNKDPGARRDKRLLMRAAFANLGKPSVRGGRLMVYGERDDFRTDRVYNFMARWKDINGEFKRFFAGRVWAGAWR